MCHDTPHIAIFIAIYQDTHKYKLIYEPRYTELRYAQGYKQWCVSQYTLHKMKYIAYAP